jgi:two-component system, OmpR family, response regulator MtrA
VTAEAKAGQPAPGGSVVNGNGVRGRVLVVDDDAALAEMLGIVLRNEGFESRVCPVGDRALADFRDYRPDLVLLDLMLPGMDGIEVCRRLRVLSATLPIIMLTARDDEVDKVLGLEIGADDYVTKPFSLAELRSRVRAVLRRAQRPAGQAGVEDVLETAGVRLDVARRTAERDGEPVQLTYVEFEILRSLMRSPGRVLSRRALLESVWDSADYREQRTIDVHIRHLREKLERDPSAPELIRTVRGVGYRFGA